MNQIKKIYFEDKVFYTTSLSYGQAEEYRITNLIDGIDKNYCEAYFKYKDAWYNVRNFQLLIELRKVVDTEQAIDFSIQGIIDLLETEGIGSKQILLKALKTISGYELLTLIESANKELIVKKGEDLIIWNLKV